MEKSENEKPEAGARAISVAPVSRCSSFLCSEATTDAEQFQSALRVKFPLPIVDSFCRFMVTSSDC
jgi:hypothetical protein